MEFVHPVDMPKICDRLGLSLKDVAKDLGFNSEKTFYKWRVPKKFGEKGSSAGRPDFETCLQLIGMGATTEELFGVPCNCRHEEAQPADPTMTEILRRLERLEQAKAKANAG